ncbi:MAG: phosphoglucosamine mutase [Myxococcaceae bacterium]
MTQRQLFGTDGIRGQANVYPITVEVMLALGRALATQVGQGIIVIGKDTRISGYALEQALAAGICSMGANVRFLGPLPTPAIAYITRSIGANLGVVISASHNSYEDNGVKIFGPDGFKLPDSKELELEKLILTPQFSNPIASKMGKAKRINDATSRYAQYLKSLITPGFNLNGLKIVLDCAHGAAYKIAPELLTDLGADLIILGNTPNGTNINHEVGSLYPQLAQKIVRDTGADLGIVLDGDADRVVLIDEKGDLVSGDSLLALLADYLNRHGKLKSNTLVSTDMSNLALEHCLKSKNIQVERTSVGDRYVVERMRQKGYSFGGEESVHLVFLDHGTTGDGLAGALMALALLQEEQKPLSELKKILTPLPRAIENRKVSKKIPFEQLPSSTALMAQFEQELGNSGRLFVRYSGTEQKLRVLVEGPDQARINQMASQVADSILKEISIF